MSTSLVSQMTERWEALEQREKLSLQVLGVALALVIAYFAIWQPAKGFMDAQQTLVQERADLLALVKSSREALASASKGSGTGAALNSQQLVSTVTNLARKQSLNLKRFEPSGESKVKVWVEDVSFDLLVSWLSNLDKNVKVKVEQISVEKQDAPGVVSARITLAS